MEQEQRGQPLLAVEGMERRSVDLAVHEVESDRLAARDRLEEDFEEADPDLLDLGVRASLSVITLDKRDLDAADRRRATWLGLEQADVRRQVALHAAVSSSGRR